MLCREGDKLINDTLLNSSSNNSDIISTVIGVALHDPQAITHLVELIASKSFTAFQKIPYIQLQNYLNRMKEIEDNYGDACKLSEKLFYDTNNRDDNALRIIKCVVNIDTQKKLDYICNVTESMLLGMIDTNMMFRLFNVVSNSLPEDLLYLSSIIENSGPFVGNVNVFALVQYQLYNNLISFYSKLKVKWEVLPLVVKMIIMQWIPKYIKLNRFAHIDCDDKLEINLSRVLPPIEDTY